MLHDVLEVVMIQGIKLNTRAGMIKRLVSNGMLTRALLIGIRFSNMVYFACFMRSFANLSLKLDE